MAAPPRQPFEHNPTHAADGIVKFAPPFWGKPRWAALFVAIAREIQELEDTARDVIVKRFLANATGAQLTVLGKLVGQIDPGLGEEVFRNLIRVRIRINRSNGTRNDVIEVLQLLGIPLAQRAITNLPPAKIRIDFTGALPIPATLLTELLNNTCSAGVGCIVVYDGTGGLQGFHFSNNTSTSTGADQLSNNTTLGQPWAGVYQV